MRSARRKVEVADEATASEDDVEIEVEEERAGRRGAAAVLARPEERAARLMARGLVREDPEDRPGSLVRWFLL